MSEEKLGLPRLMPISPNANETAQDFIQKYVQSNGGLKQIEKFEKNNGLFIFVYQLNSGGYVVFRPVGSGIKTTQTSAIVEINTEQVKAINGQKCLKLEFPMKVI
ncbi:MAG: hypothetical protein IJ187_08430 [Neisseriaceae bacterium]|nr:hypothetical protein [Neisseriaceae bacterium]